MCCTLKYLISMCHVFPKPLLDALASAALEAVHASTSACTPNIRQRRLHPQTFSCSRDPVRRTSLPCPVRVSPVSSTNAPPQSFHPNTVRPVCSLVKMWVADATLGNQMDSDKCAPLHSWRKAPTRNREHSVEGWPRLGTTMTPRAAS